MDRPFCFNCHLRFMERSAKLLQRAFGERPYDGVAGVFVGAIMDRPFCFNYHLRFMKRCAKMLQRAFGERPYDGVAGVLLRNKAR